MTRTIDDPVYVRVSPSVAERSLPHVTSGRSLAGHPITERPRVEHSSLEHAESEQHADERPAPDQFIWRDRLYVVREVLGRWRERQAWWSGPAARAVGGQASTVAELSAAADREIWRVQAVNGRREAGVFDLSADPVADGDQRWRLLRVVD